MPDDASNPPAQPAPQPAVCVAWSPVGVPLDPRLQGALKRPGLEVAACDDPFSVLAVLTSAHLGGAGAKILLLVEPQRLPSVIDLLDIAPRYVPEMAIWLFDPSRQPVLRSVKATDVLVALGARMATAPEPRRSVSAPAPRPAIAPAQSNDQPSGPVAWTGPWVASTTQKWNEPTNGLRLAGDGTLPARDDVREDDVDAFAEGSPAPAAASAAAPATPPRANPRVLTEEELAMLLGDDTGPSGRKP